jgi:probable rRNA maturation factor
LIHTLISECFETVLEPVVLVRAVEAVLTQQAHEAQVELTVVIEDDNYLRELNNQFLGIDVPTDVLSFPAEEIDPDTGLSYMGDIVISYPRALEQASAAGETVTDELQLLVVHGTLHLLGFDHAESDEKSAMWFAQRQALDLLGCKIRRLPE